MNSGSFYQFHNDGITFSSKEACAIKTIYAPLCGSDASGLKSAISPFLSGDIKLDKYHYLTKPASREDLRYPLREFFVFIKGKGVFSLAQESSPNSAVMTMGPLWHSLERTHKKAGLLLSAVHVVPSSNETLELAKITIKNISHKKISFTPTAAIPIFARSLANKHDHEHVTSLLNRIEQSKDGVLVKPSMAFNEEGHKEVQKVYFVFGRQEKGGSLTGTFPDRKSVV